MKKVLSILVVICMMLSMVSVASAADYALAINGNVAIMVGNSNAIAWNSIVTTTAPVMADDVMLAPVAFVAGGFNAKVETTGIMTTITMGDTTAYMVEGNKNVVVNGRVYVSPVAPTMVNGALMLPVEFLGETVLGKHVYYDEATKMAVITHRKCLSSRDKDVLATISGALTSGVLPAIVIQAPVAQFTGSGIGGGVVNDTTGELVASPSGNKVSLTNSMLSASQTPEAQNHAGNLLDGNTQTAWASQGEASLTINLGSAMTVSAVGVAMKMYEDDRTIPYDVEISADGSSYTQVWTGSSEARTDAMQYIGFSAGARYVRITAHGNTISGWNSIGEVAVYSTGGANLGTTTGTTTPVAGGVKGSVVAAASGSKVTLTQSMLKASQTPEAENHVGNLIDGNKMTVWASQNEANVVIDLGSAQTVSTVGVAMKMYEDTRTIPYKIEISTDGASYAEIWSGESDAGTDTTKYVSVGSAAKYVRITAYGNTVSGWNSIAEVEVYSSGAATGVATTTTTTAATGTAATTASGTKVTLTESMLKASQTPEAENHVGNLIDGNKMTVWASQNEANVVIDLGSAKTISSVGVAMKMYEDTRTIPYKVEVSADGASYSEIWSGDSEPGTDTTKYVSTSTSARYVKVTAYGNTVSGWNSIAEVEVYTK